MRKYILTKTRGLCNIIKCVYVQKILQQKKDEYEYIDYWFFWIYLLGVSFKVHSRWTILSLNLNILDTATGINTVAMKIVLFLTNSIMFFLYQIFFYSKHALDILYRIFQKVNQSNRNVSFYFLWNTLLMKSCIGYFLSLIHIWRCRRNGQCRSRWSPYH